VEEVDSARSELADMSYNEGNLRKLLVLASNPKVREFLELIEKDG